jgi:hypothetical protein
MHKACSQYGHSFACFRLVGANVHRTIQASKVLSAGVPHSPSSASRGVPSADGLSLLMGQVLMCAQGRRHQQGSECGIPAPAEELHQAEWPVHLPNEVRALIPVMASPSTSDASLLRRWQQRRMRKAQAAFTAMGMCLWRCEACC